MTTYKRGSMADAGIAIIVGLLIGLAAAQLVNPSAPAAKASESAAFDHSGCQYPHRTTNPPNGCDNSDPCDPANVKGGSGDCVTLPETNKEPVITAAPTNPAPAKAECGGN